MIFIIKYSLYYHINPFFNIIIIDFKWKQEIFKIYFKYLKTYLHQEM
jgi:hypothetical protein